MEGHGLRCHGVTGQFADVSVPGMSGQVSGVILLRAIYKIELLCFAK